MGDASYSALIVEETEDGGFRRSIRQKTTDELPPGDVLIRVRYSSLNYKDALYASGNRGVTRRYPHTPGIDAAGSVEESVVDDFRPGDRIIVAGLDLGMNTPGGFWQYIRVPAHWIVRLPENLSLKESMIYGSAGFTSAFSVYKLEQYITPEQGKILVTGATGGVGCIAVALLARDGYHVVAATGKPEEKDFLTGLGAREIIHRDEVRDESGKALLKRQWAGVIDTVGGDYLATALKSTTYGGVVTCCGNVASPDLTMTVYPFILRGVSLLGIDAVHCPSDIRLKLWRRLAGEWKFDNLDSLCHEISLKELDISIERMLHGRLKGRTVVDLGKLPSK